MNVKGICLLCNWFKGLKKPTEAAFAILLLFFEGSRVAKFWSGFGRCWATYNASQKHESTLLHTYTLNEFLTADRSCTAIFFEKTLTEDGS